LTLTLAAVGAVSAQRGAKPFVLDDDVPSQGQTEVVERVLDGDTLIVKGWRERVRLANIDAPEMSHGYGKPGQPFSVKSTEWLAAEIQGRRVELRCVDQDRYGRQVCDVFKGSDHVNKRLVQAGLAWANTANPRYLRDKSVLRAQREAQDAHRGLWADASPTPPWQWRLTCWERGVCK